MKVGIGNDHAAVELKMQIKEFIESMGHEVVNYGVDTAESCNYPEIGEKVGRAVADGEVDWEGLSECGISWWTSCDTRGYACGHRKTEQIKYLKSIPFYSKIVSRETLYS